ncbi:MAG: S8 family serine peptidase [Acidimicrobiales bacterium]
MRRALATLVGAVLGAAVLVMPVAALPNDPLADRQWGTDVIGAETAWSAGRGAGTVIAIVDTGVHLDHPDLRDKLVAGRDFVDGDAHPQDGHGHGTHVAGTAAAATGNGIGVAGVAPDARIMPVRVLADDGNGSGANISAGIRWAADNGATVINLSLGSDTQAVLGPSFSEAIRHAWSKGSIPVVAAGNQFVTGSGFADQPAIVVTATSREDTKAYFSSTTGSARWPISAPGGARNLTDPVEDDILSTYHTPGRPADEYAYLAGTSMAAPHVAGAAAVLRGLGLSPQQTVDRLLATAKDLGPRGRDSTFGAGRLDLAAAVAGLGPGSAPPTTAPPAPPPAGRAAPPASEPDPTPGATPPGEPTASTATPEAEPAPAAGPVVEGETTTTLAGPEAVEEAEEPEPDDAVALTGDGTPSGREAPDGGDAGPAALLAGALAAAGGVGALVVRRRGTI